MNREKLLFAFWILLFNSILIFSQTDYYIKVLNSGNEAFNCGNYELADSLYSLCIDKSINGDIFFNRAFARLNLLDTCGYCNDLFASSSLFFDKEASKFYRKDCFESSDTTYYSKEMIKVDPKDKYRYYEVNSKLLCDSVKYYDLHDKRNKKYVKTVNENVLSSLITGPNGTIDYLARAVYRDSIKVYYYFDNININSFLDQSLKNYMLKYSLLFGMKNKQIKKQEKESVDIWILVDDYGKILEEEVIENDTINCNILDFVNFKQELENIIKNSPNIKPILFQNKPVYFQGYYKFEF
ncbi:MAG: hypothetical protein H6540_09150 [Bacteroidales bacterium]|nr:hypothetical protein [Bacteroidales bacterium]MCB9014037.1 hypothetical protein [Bacteroidales bacterium]